MTTADNRRGARRHAVTSGAGQETATDTHPEAESGSYVDHDGHHLQAVQGTYVDEDGHNHAGETGCYTDVDGRHTYPDHAGRYIQAQHR